MKHVVALLLSLLAIAILIPWQVFVITTLWGWFVVASTGLPQLTSSAAVGLILIFDCLKGMSFDGDAAPLSPFDVFLHFLVGLVPPGVALAVGYVIVIF